MKISQKYLSLFCAMVMVGVIAMPSDAAISFSASRKTKPKTIEITRYLDASNPDLRRALDIHNLINEMPDIRDILHTEKDLNDQKSMLSQQLEAMNACNAGKLGSVFKEPKKVWGKMVDAYEKKRQASGQKEGAQKGLSDILKGQEEDKQKSAQIGRDIVNDVYKNSSKWGQMDTNSKEKLALKDGKLTASGEVSSDDLELAYSMRLVFDSMEKGSLSVNGTSSGMQQNFAKKLADVGIDAPDLNLSNHGQYLKIQKRLKEEKKKAIAAAQKYIALLEKQDEEHPELVQKRRDYQAKKQARLSEEAQQAMAQSDGIIQISQMTPVMQQKFVVAALEKDKDALVRLTETNAMDVDQMIRERQATNKIIAESQKQMKTIYDKQLENMPLFTNCTVF